MVITTPRILRRLGLGRLYVWAQLRRACRTGIVIVDCVAGGNGGAGLGDLRAITMAEPRR